ncbi:hypothetical protein FNF31_06759 [Cafeteria roenbergensis]|nr:hypothetical protein FNF31_06759 [Cafeteria roenbergensis]
MRIALLMAATLLLGYWLGSVTGGGGRGSAGAVSRQATAAAGSTPQRLRAEAAPQPDDGGSASNTAESLATPEAPPGATDASSAPPSSSAGAERGQAGEAQATTSPSEATGAALASLPAAPGGWTADDCPTPGRARDAKASNTNWVDVGSPDKRLLTAVRQGGVRAESGDVLFDVGANQGAFALLLAEVWPKATYLLFEMMPTYGEFINKTFAAHDARDRVRIIPHAVSSVSGESVPILGDPGHVAAYKGWTGASLLKRGKNFGAKIAEATTVALGEWITTLPLDEQIPEIIPFVKIDTEGFDGAVLKGMEAGKNMLLNQRTRAIFFELNKMSLSSDFKPEATLELLSGYGYDTYLILNEGLFRISDECFEPSEYTAEALWTRNALALPRGTKLACCVLTAYDSEDRGCDCQAEARPRVAHERAAQAADAADA